MDKLFAGTLRAMGVPMKNDRTMGGTPAWPTHPIDPGPYWRGPDLAPPRAAPAPQPHGMGVDWPYVSKEQLGGRDIFVGGALDDIALPLRGYGELHDYAGRYAQQTNRPTEYLPNNRPGQLRNAIRQANGSGGPVDLVGYSLGANDVYEAAAAARREGLRVDNVVTLDPVGRGHSPGQGLDAAWTNIEALSPGGSTGDLAAWSGGKPSSLPVDQARARLQVPAHHDEAFKMMTHGGRQVLDASRARPQTPSWEDELPTWEWMQRRNASLSRGRP